MGSDSTIYESPSYYNPAGLEKNFDNTYTLTDKYGNKQEFDANGRLTDRVDYLEEGKGDESNLNTYQCE